MGTPAPNCRLEPASACSEFLQLRAEGPRTERGRCAARTPRGRGRICFLSWEGAGCSFRSLPAPNRRESRLFRKQGDRGPGARPEAGFRDRGLDEKAASPLDRSRLLGAKGQSLPRTGKAKGWSWRGSDMGSGGAQGRGPVHRGLRGPLCPSWETRAHPPASVLCRALCPHQGGPVCVLRPGAASPSAGGLTSSQHPPVCVVPGT